MTGRSNGYALKPSLSEALSKAAAASAQSLFQLKVRRTLYTLARLGA